MSLEELKKEADDLGITYSPNIGEAKLQAKIDEYYASQETSGKELEAAVKAIEQSEVKTVATGKKSFREKAKEIELAARKTRVITIIDNDQRVNNQTTTCSVNCSCKYFDLGQMILPLNTPVEVMQGHIDVLKEVRIPQHVRDNKTGLSRVVLRPRYTISYER